MRTAVIAPETPTHGHSHCRPLSPTTWKGLAARLRCRCQNVSCTLSAVNTACTVGFSSHTGRNFFAAHASARLSSTVAFLTRSVASLPKVCGRGTLSTLRLGDSQIAKRTFSKIPHPITMNLYGLGLHCQLALNLYASRYVCLHIHTHIHSQIARPPCHIGPDAAVVVPEAERHLPDTGCGRGRGAHQLRSTAAGQGVYGCVRHGQLR